MKLYKLGHNKPLDFPYDCDIGYVVVAHSENEARKKVNEKSYGDQGRVWEDQERTWCKEINLEEFTEATILLHDFQAG